MAFLVRRGYSACLHTLDSVLPHRVFYLGVRAYTNRRPVVREQLTAAVDEGEEKIYNEPVIQAFRKALDIAEKPPAVNEYTIMIDDPTGKFSLKEPGQEARQPWLQRKRVSKRKDIYSDLKAFAQALGRGSHMQSEKLKNILHEHSEALAPAFKSRLREQSPRVIVLPEIRGVTYLTIKSLNLKMNFYRKQGLSLEDTCKMLSEWPLLLNEDLVTVQKKINFLVGVGYNTRMVRLVFRRAAKAFMLPLEDVFEARVSDVKDFPISPKLTRMDAIDVLQRCPTLLILRDSDKLFHKVQYMRKELRFSKQQVRNLIMRQPSVLTMRMETMKEKMDFCLGVLGASRSNIARCPRLFQCSLQRLEERHAFLYMKGLVDPNVGLNDFGLGVLSTAPDTVFVKEVGRATSEEYQKFVETYRKEKNNRTREGEEGAKDGMKEEEASGDEGGEEEK